MSTSTLVKNTKAPLQSKIVWDDCPSSEGIVLTPFVNQNQTPVPWQIPILVMTMMKILRTQKRQWWCWTTRLKKILRVIIRYKHLQITKIGGHKWFPFVVSEQALFEVQIDTDTKKMIPNSKSSSEQYADRYDARVIVLICVWYFFSACTLYLNKYLVAFENADSATLSSCQMLMTMFLGFFQQRHSLGTYAERDLCDWYS